MKVAVGLRRVAAGKRTSGRRAAQIALRRRVDTLRDILKMYWLFSISLGSPPNKKTVFWAGLFYMSLILLIPTKFCFEFGGIFLCWSESDTPLLILSGNYL